MVCAMEEPEVVAAIVAGDPAGLTEALDKYATSLFAYCRSILPQAASAQVVEDTFVVARTKLDGLHDPARLGQWLQAVARNECFRRVMADGGTPPAEPLTPVPDLTLPDGLHGRIMMVCTDDTPTGRAHRTTVTHRAGQFGHDGFPKPVTVAKRRRVPRAAAAAAAVAGVIVIVVVLVITLSGGPPSSGQLTVSGLGNPTGVVGASNPVSGAGPSQTAGSGHSGKPKVNLEATRSSAPSPAALPTVVTTGNPTSTPGSRPGPPASTPPAVKPSKVAAQPTPSVSTSTYTPPPNPILIVNPGSISLVSVNGAVAAGSISILGYGGAVSWSASVSTNGGHISVGPAEGTLKPGASTTIGVAASGTVSFTARVTIMPGDHVVTVTVTAKKVVTKKVITNGRAALPY